MKLSEALGSAVSESVTFRVKLTSAQQETIGEFDNGNWLSDVGLTSVGRGVFEGDLLAMRRLAGAFDDRADPMDDFGLSSAQRRTAKAAAKAVRKVMASAG